MEVITTHLNADFDAFASIVAAKKLYPAALVVFPGSREKNLRDFFMESSLYILSIERVKDLDFDSIHRIILVDTRQKSRIGQLGPICDRPDVDVHVYDHHPASDEDIRGSVEVIKPYGATVSIFIEMLRQRGFHLNAEEATILSLGIYEDTGSFTFSSTTPNDLEAAAWLVSEGANLNIVSNMMTSELNRDQIDIMHQLIEEARLVHIGGVDVVVAIAGAEGYIGDLAILVHKFKDMESHDAIVALIRMEDRVHLIARSSVDSVNVGEIAACFGGGGHPTAASATIKDMTLYEARDRVVALLHEKVRPKQKAIEIMSKPVVTVRPDQTIGEAAELLGRYQISSLPVERSESLLGILHRHAVDKATHHGLHNHLVSDFMNPGVVFVTPEDSIDRVLQVSVEGRHRLVPVIDEGRMVGVISRSDLLEHLKLPRSSDPAGPENFSQEREKRKNVKKLLQERLPKRVINVLRTAGDVADRNSSSVYLVGGAVRDLLLRNHNLDIDLVIEGEGIPFAQQLVQDCADCRLRSHAKFGTAVILFDDGFKVDIATARHEYYESPGALPTVEMSSIKRDLFRRDFTVNTLAISLNSDSWGELIDFFGGVRDIKDKTIRVLHNLAFVEDPTRILRAIRFSSRFNFMIGKHTMSLIKGALKLKIFDRVEGKRILNELIHVLDEKTPLPAIKSMSELGILQAIYPPLIINSRTYSLIDSVSAVLSWWKYLFLDDKIQSWIVYYHALTDSVDEKSFEGALQRLSVPAGHAIHLVNERAKLKSALGVLDRGRLTKPSEIFKLLEKSALESLLYIMAKTTREQTRKTVSEHIIHYRNVKPLLNGSYLKSLGLAPGPLFGTILGYLRDARLDGITRTVEDEQKLISEYFQDIPALKGTRCLDLNS